MERCRSLERKHQQLSLVTLRSGTEKTFHIVKAFQDFWLVGALRVLFFPLATQHSIFHVLKELGFIKTCPAISIHLKNLILLHYEAIFNFLWGRRVEVCATFPIQEQNTFNAAL